MKSIAVLVILLMVATTQALTLFVASDGRDTWSGKAPTRTGADGPKATLPAAVESARAARRQPNFAEPITIELRGGTYDLTEAVRLTSEDSGATASSPFVISAYQGEK